MDGEKIQLEGAKGHTSEHGRNINSPVAKEKIRISPTGSDTQPSLVAMELPEVRGQDGSNDDSEGAAVTNETTKHTGFPTNDRSAAINCRVLIIIQPTMSIKLKIKEK